MFEKIKENHIIEIYDRENIQIFRNFNFFDVVSYTLEDVLCRPWTELFIRENPEHSASILNAVEKFYSAEEVNVTSLEHVGTQRLSEQDSPFNLKVDLIVNYVAPIYFADRSAAGFVAIETGELACVMPENVEAEKLLSAYYLNEEFKDFEI